MIAVNNSLQPTKMSVLSKHIQRDRMLLLMLLPGIIWYIIFCYLPIGGVVIAFEKYSVFKGILGSKWVWFDNFKTVLTSPYFPRLMRNTFLLGLYSFLWGIPTPVIFALLLNEIRNITVKKLTQTVSYFPYFISTVVLVGLMRTLLDTNGVINNILMQYFGVQKPVLFFSSNLYFRTLYQASGIWQGLGWSSVIYLGAISGINQELYEAAYIDGSNRLKNLWHITLPHLFPTISIIMIMSMGGLFNASTEKILLMYSPATYETADVIGTYIYRAAMTGSHDFSGGTAIGLFLALINFILVFGSNAFARRFTEYSLW